VRHRQACVISDSEISKIARLGSSASAAALYKKEIPPARARSVPPPRFWTTITSRAYHLDPSFPPEMAATAVASHPAPPTMNTFSHPFTCNTCQVAFRSSDLQRTHMTSDWHRYNLKRRVASLPPLASEVFAEKVLANKASAAATAARASFEKRCEACEKVYYSENSYANHVHSQKHRVLAARLASKVGHETESMADSSFSLGDPMDTASTTASTVTVNADETAKADDEFKKVIESMAKTGLEPALPNRPVLGHQSRDGEPVDNADDDQEYEHKAELRQCLFCNYVSPSLELNLNHMSRQHGFFLPERDYLVDLPGLINYLSETVLVLHTCLYCHKSVHTSSGVQTHMRDRGHCMIAYSTEEEQLEIGDFYDFRATYSGDETDDDDEVATGGVSLGAKRVINTTTEGEDGEDEEVEDDDEGWESDSTLSSVPTDELTSVPIEHQDHKYAKLHLHKHHSHTDARPHRDSDGFHSHAHHRPHAVYRDEYELHLPTGRTAGHRSLQVYYRQNLRNYPTSDERARQRMLEDGRHDSGSDDEETVRSESGRGRARQQLVTRANGGRGLIAASEPLRREACALEKTDRKRQLRAQDRQQSGMDKRANNRGRFNAKGLQSVGW